MVSDPGRGDLEIRIKNTHIEVKQIFLTSHLFIPCSFLFLFKTHVARVMKQLRERGQGAVDWREKIQLMLVFCP